VQRLSESYGSEGCTDVLAVADPEELEPIQDLIWRMTAHLLPRDAASLPLAERLRLPFAEEPTPGDLSSLMNTVNASRELSVLLGLPRVVAGLGAALGTDAIEPFPITRFRAQIPGVVRSTFAWHQDEATWYAVKVKTLAYRLPATLWLSLNGAHAANSIEYIPRSHGFGLVHHRYQEGQGYFRALVPTEVETLERRRAETKPGEGIVLHPLLFHRSVPAESGPPRYSVDVRYCVRGRRDLSHSIDWRLRVKRWLAR
jgi:hypothetical protein